MTKKESYSMEQSDSDLSSSDAQPAATVDIDEKLGHNGDPYNLPVSVLFRLTVIILGEKSVPLARTLLHGNWRCWR